MSPFAMTFAMFRCTKTSPGMRSMTVVSGTLESEHPIHRILGCCEWVKDGKKPGVDEVTRSDHTLFLSSRSSTLQSSLKKAFLATLLYWIETEYESPF